MVDTATLVREVVRRRDVRTRARADAADPLALLKRWLPDAFGLPYGPQHDYLANLLHPDGPRGLRAWVGAGRGMGKSTTNLLGNPLVAAIRRSHQFILIVRATGDDAVTSVETIKDTIEDNPGLVQRYPWLEVVSYSQGELRLKGMIVLGRGAGSAIRGLVRNLNGQQVRPDLVLLDDIETEDQARSQLRTNRLGKWVLGPVSRLSGPPGEADTSPLDIIAIGTTLAPDSLCTRVLDNRGEFASWTTARFPAEAFVGVDDDGYAVAIDSRGRQLPRIETPDGAMEGTPFATWPEGMSLAYLRRLTTPGDDEFIGTVTYAQEMLLEPIADEDRKVQRSWFRYCALDPDRGVLIRDDGLEVELDELVVGAYLDPAFGTKRTNDRSAIVVGGADDQGNLYLLASWAGRQEEGIVLDTMEALGSRWEARVYGIESVAAQVLMARMARRRGLVVEPVRSAADKGVRIGALGTRYQGRTVFHLRSGTGLSEYEDETEAFPTAPHDDLPDAGAGLAELLLGAKAKVKRSRLRV